MTKTTILVLIDVQAWPRKRLLRYAGRTCTHEFELEEDARLTHELVESVRLRPNAVGEQATEPEVA